MKKGKKHNSIVDYYLALDEEIGFSTKKFSEVQKLKQRRRKIKKKDIINNKKRVLQ